MLRYFCLKNTRHFKQKTDLVDFDGPNKKKQQQNLNTRYTQ